jgi:hypothetical protein
MSLLFMEGFDQYKDQTYIIGTAKWANVTSAGTLTTGRLGGNSWRTVNSDILTSITMPNTATWIVGMAIQFSAFRAATILRLLDGSSVQLAVAETASGALSVSRGSTVLATSAAVLSTGIWHYLEFKATINNTTGSYELRLNGKPILSGTSADTQDTANAYANKFSIGQSGVGVGYVYFDDIYVLDDAGTFNNDFLGDVAVFTRYPASDESVSFTPSTGAANYPLVGQVSTGDADYVSSATPGDTDVYGLSALSTPGTPQVVAGVAVSARGWKTDAGGRTARVNLLSGSSTLSGATIAITTSAMWFEKITETDPATSGAWTVSGVEAVRAGIEVVS